MKKSWTDEDIRRVFLQESAQKLAIPIQEDLFNYQIELLDSNYDLLNSWNLFCTQLDCDFGGNLEKYIQAKTRYSSNITNFYTENKVDEKVRNFVESNNLKYTDISGDLLPEHTYLKVDLRHAYSQALEYFNILPISECEIQKKFAESKHISECKLARLASYVCLDRDVFKPLVEHLLNLAVEQNEQPFRQLQLMGIPVVRKDLDDLVYDITDFEDTFSSFVGPLEIANIKLNVSIFKRRSTFFYYDYAFWIASSRQDLTTDKRVFDYAFAKFAPQLTKLELGQSIAEKDLWWQDFSGLHRLSKPVRQIILGPETILE